MRKTKKALNLNFKKTTVFFIVIFVLVLHSWCETGLVIRKDSYNKSNNEFFQRLSYFQDNGGMKNDIPDNRLVPFITAVVEPQLIEDREPFKLVILLDTSASVKTEKERSIGLFMDILDKTPDNSVKAYATFSNRMRVFKRPESAEPENIKEHLEKIDFKGPTAYFDSIYYALDLFDEGAPLEKKLLVVVSDGIDEVNVGSAQLMSVYSMKDCIDKANKKGVKCLTLALGTERRSEYNLKGIAEGTEAKMITDTKSFSNFLEDMLRDRFTIILDDPFLKDQLYTREVNISVNYKGDTLNILSEIDMKNKDRKFPDDVFSVYKEYRISLEDIIIDSPKIILTAYAYRYGKNTNAPKVEDIKVSVRCQVSPYKVDRGKDPHNIALLLDKSGSMERLWDKYLELISVFNLKVQDNERIHLYSFDSNLKRIPGNKFDVNPFLIRKNVIPKGSTALFDSLFKEVLELYSVKGQKSILLLSDGIDQRYEMDKAPMSKKKLKDVKWALKDSKIPLYAMTFHKEANHFVLKQLSIYSGGKYFYSPTEKSIDEFFSSIRKSVSGYYDITFSFPGFILDETKVMTEILYFKDKEEQDSCSRLYTINP